MLPRAPRSLPPFPHDALPIFEAPGLAELTGRGVYYGASASEARTYRDQDVYIVGAANSAGQAALDLARFARRVVRSEEHTSELQSLTNLVCRLLLEKTKKHTQ